MQMFDILSMKNSQRLYFLIALILGNLLLLTPEGTMFRVIGTLILLLLPGLTWADRLSLSDNRLVRWVVGLGLSYALIVIFGLILHYLPGPTPLWAILLVLNVSVLGAVILPQRFWRGGSILISDSSVQFSKVSLVLITILLASAVLRFYGLGYSEFAADEIKPMVAAAESLVGHEDALFVNRKKGPGEIMIPMMVWPLTGTINESTARFPVALAGVLAVLTIYLVANKLVGEKTGLMAAGLLALNGYMVGFSRILQYQQIVIWISLLALLCTWEWRESGRFRWGVLTGVFLGVGLLYHYDALLIIPALIYLILSKPEFARANLKSLIFVIFIMAAIVILFLWPYAANPQADFTANYVAGRVGQTLLKNNLFDFFHYTIFYNSFYYVVSTGLLLLAFLVWAIAKIPVIRRTSAAYYLAPTLAVGAVLYSSIYPDGFFLPSLNLDLAFLPYFLILLGAFLSPSVDVGHKTVVVWLAAAFLGYTFGVADPRTHFYTISPAWVMLAAVAAVWLWFHLASINYYVPMAATLALTILFSGYLYIAFLRQNIEFWNQWPESQPAFYWSPYQEKPRHQFGFVHQDGWKAVGGLYALNQLAGRFGTNSGSGLHGWYSQQALWGCECCQPKPYYFAFDYKEIDSAALTNYEAIGQIRLPTNGKGVTIYQAAPATTKLEPFQVEPLYQAFDRMAWPATFALPRGEPHRVDVNLANLFRLTGYDLIAPQPKPVETMAVTLYWQRTPTYSPINFDVFVQLEDAAGHIWGQSNGAPNCGKQLTSTWAEQEIVVDPHIIPIDPQTPPGDYFLAVGMSVSGENFRLPVVTEEGQSETEVVKLGTVTIE
jgi:4-amino-4-deoxy-L-arabinose transferase-like glycosyltransferase